MQTDTYTQKALDSLFIALGVAVVPYFWASGAMTSPKIEAIGFVPSMILVVSSIAAIGYGLKRGGDCGGGGD